jgi:HK97 gp10 family phage protein
MKATLDTRTLERIAASIGGNADQALSAVAFQVEAEAKVRAPVDTGALKNSIHAERKRRGLYWVADGVEYGIYQELGTSRMAAQPFLVPAVEAVRGLIERVWGGLTRG